MLFFKLGRFFLLSVLEVLEIWFSSGDVCHRSHDR